MGNYEKEGGKKGKEKTENTVDSVISEKLSRPLDGI